MPTVESVSYVNPTNILSMLWTSHLPISQPTFFARSSSPVKDGGSTATRKSLSGVQLSQRDTNSCCTFDNDGEFSGVFEGATDRLSNDDTAIAIHLPLKPTKQCQVEDDPESDAQQSKRNRIFAYQRRLHDDRLVTRTHYARDMDPGDHVGNDDDDDNNNDIVGDNDDEFPVDSPATGPMQQLTTIQSSESVERRNLRERKRIGKINSIFSVLFDRLPSHFWHHPAPGRYVAASDRSDEDRRRCRRLTKGGESRRAGRKRPSKVDTLRAAIEYIRCLQQLLVDSDGEVMKSALYDANDECSFGLSLSSSVLADAPVTALPSTIDRQRYVHCSSTVLSEEDAQQLPSPSTCCSPSSGYSLPRPHMVNSQDRRHDKHHGDVVKPIMIVSGETCSPIATSGSRSPDYGGDEIVRTPNGYSATTGCFVRLCSSATPTCEISSKSAGLTSDGGSSEEFQNLIAWLMHDNGDMSFRDN